MSTQQKRGIAAGAGIYWRTWRKRGAAKLDHRLWAYWAIFGRYPKLSPSTDRLNGGAE